MSFTRAIAAFSLSTLKEGIPASVEDHLLATCYQRDSVGQTPQAIGGNDDRSLIVRVNDVAVMDKHAAHFDGIAELGDMDMGVARPDMASQDLKALGKGRNVPEGTIGNAADRPKRLVHEAIDFAPERAGARMSVAIFDDDHGRQVRRSDIFVPARAIGNGSLQRRLGADAANAGDTDDRSKAGPRSGKRAFGISPVTTFRPKDFQCVAQRCRVDPR